MKALFLGLALLSQPILASNENAQIQVLECQGDSSHTRMSIVLDSSPYEEGSGYSNPISARLQHHFTSIPEMVCTGFVFENDFSRMRCAGYYSWGDTLSEITVTNENEKLTGNWTTIHGVESTMDCKLQK